MTTYTGTPLPTSPPSRAGHRLTVVLPGGPGGRARAPKRETPPQWVATAYWQNVAANDLGQVPGKGVSRVLLRPFAAIAPDRIGAIPPFCGPRLRAGALKARGRRPFHPAAPRTAVHFVGTDRSALHRTDLAAINVLEGEGPWRPRNTARTGSPRNKIGRAHV